MLWVQLAYYLFRACHEKLYAGFYSILSFINLNLHMKLCFTATAILQLFRSPLPSLYIPAIFAWPWTVWDSSCWFCVFWVGRHPPLTRGAVRPVHWTFFYWNTHGTNSWNVKWRTKFLSCWMLVVDLSNFEHGTAYHSFLGGSGWNIKLSGHQNDAMSDYMDVWASPVPHWCQRSSLTITHIPSEQGGSAY